MSATSASSANESLEQAGLAATPDAPIAPSARVPALDILRGFAVMAIFLVNIKGMAMPFPYYSNPSLWASEVDQHIAVLQKYLVDDRWRTIFTMLFGAGMALIGEKTMAKGAGTGTGRLLIRNMWLMVFGAWHLILIWNGDILFSYAMAGFLAMWFRHMSLRMLIVWCSVLLIFATAWAGFMMLGPLYSPELAAELGPMMWGTDPAYIEEQIEIFQGPISGQILTRLSDAVGFILFYMVLGGFLAVTVALMLWGMVLYRIGFLRATWPVAGYLLVAGIGLGVGSAIEWHTVTVIKASGYDYLTATSVMPLSLIDSYFAAMGFAALIMGLVKAGMRFRPVAAVGRMAFTNYILSSLIGTTLAGGHAWGFGWFGEVTLVQLMAVCLVTFVGMLIWSPLWLRVFRFGPLEWLWRSLTYGRAQPFLR